MGTSERSVFLRLLWVGLLVVIGTTSGSLIMGHISFSGPDPISYKHAMLTAFVIPCIVTPPAYGYVAWLTWRLHATNRSLETIAWQDPLTGILNRRAFTDQANNRLARARRQVLVMADIDHFKAINDSMGHAAGDLALQHTAAILAETAPPQSLVARIGGEEFALMFGVADGDCHEALVDRIRQKLEHMPLVTPQGLARLTASFGIAVSSPGETLDNLLSRADVALYGAKDDGRNRIRNAA